MSKRTPGPWIATDAPHVITDWPKVGFLTTVANCRIGGGGVDEWMANARLIAAAPELLDAAKLVDSLLYALGWNGNEASILRAAIAKAEGTDLRPIAAKEPGTDSNSI